MAPELPRDDHLRGGAALVAKTGNEQMLDEHAVRFHEQVGVKNEARPYFLPVVLAAKNLLKGT